MFEISEKLLWEQTDEIFGVSQISWENSVSRMQRFYAFSDSVLRLGKVNQNSTSNSAWEDKLMWFRSSSEYRTLDTIDGEPMEFE